MNAIVDTTIWSLAYRRAAHALSPLERLYLQVLKDLASDDRAQMLGVVRQELLSGLRETAQFERLRRTLAAFTNITVGAEDHEEAARMFNTCRAKGITGGVVDILICAASSRRGWAILTLDQDFELYSRHLPIKLVKVS